MPTYIACYNIENDLHVIAHAESFNAGDWMSIEEATGTSYTIKVSLSFPFYTDRIIIVMRKLYKQKLSLEQ